MDTGVTIALILGVAQVIAAGIALFATLNTNNNRKLKRLLKKYSREIYMLNEEIVILMDSFIECVKDSINDTAPLKPNSIRENLRSAATRELEFSSSRIDVNNNEELQEYMDMETIKIIKAVPFKYKDERRKC